MSEVARGATEVASAPDVSGQEVPKLTAVRGPATGRAFAFVRSFGTVGRHPTNDFVLDDPRVSGVHLELTRAGTRVRVRDVGSTNGTWLGSHRVLDLELARGAEVTVGDSVLRLDVESDAAVPALPEREAFGELVGRSRMMRELFATLERIASKDLGVLVQGETGTGKEEVARALHEASPRARGPFVVVDATSLPDTLVESLLFGHEKGAFTGATERRAGLFEAASGGTVLIDEVGELPLPLQAKFLRVLERREVVRVGGHAPVPVDVRVISATHRDLRREIEQGRFREDLYFRLAQVRVFVPPLRARPEDVGLVARRILARAGAATTLDPDAETYLAAQPWPGNVRELKNVLLRAVALTPGPVVRPSDVAGEGGGFRGTADERSPLDLSGTFSTAKDRAVERFERAYLALLMKRVGGNLSAGAREADLARHHLRDLLKKRGLYGVSLGDE